MMSFFPARPPLRPRAAFTLIELMVAMSISILLLVLLVNLSVQSMDVTKRTTESSQTVSAASAALDMVAMDLESLAANLPDSEYLQTQIGNVEDVPNVTQLTMLTISPVDSDGNATDQGQVRAVRYQLLRADPITGDDDKRTPYGLYRTAVSADKTFEKIIGLSDLSDAKEFPASPPANDFLVPNVVEFQIAFYRAIDPASGNGTLSSGSSTRPINKTGSDAYYAVRLASNSVKVNNTDVDPTTGQPYLRPKSAEITLTILDETGAKLLRESNNVSLDFLIQKYGRRAARRVNLASPN